MAKMNDMKAHHQRYSTGSLNPNKNLEITFYNLVTATS